MHRRYRDIFILLAMTRWNDSRRMAQFRNNDCLFSSRCRGRLVGPVYGAQRAEKPSDIGVGTTAFVIGEAIRDSDWSPVVQR
jgi:hypothetical protein